MRLVNQQGVGGNGTERLGDGKEVVGFKESDTCLNTFFWVALTLGTQVMFHIPPFQ